MILLQEPGGQANPEALHLLERALAKTVEAKGDMHVETAQSAFIFGMTAQNMQKFDKAIPALQRALRIRRHVHGQNDSATAISVGALANAFAANGNLEQAEILYREAIGIAEHVLGKVHTNTGYAYSSLAKCLENGKNYDEAIAALETALGVHEDVARKTALDFQVISVAESVSSSPDVLKTAIALGTLMRHAGKDPTSVFERFGG